jgi:hypothetical protein
MDQRSMPQRPSPATPTVGCRYQHRRRFCRGEAITCHKNTHTRVTPHTEAQPWPVDSSTGHPAGHNDHRPQGPQVTCHSAPAWPQATLGSSQPLSHAVSRHIRKSNMQFLKIISWPDLASPVVCSHQKRRVTQNLVHSFFGFQISSYCFVS